MTVARKRNTSSAPKTKLKPQASPSVTSKQEDPAEGKHQDSRQAIPTVITDKTVLPRQKAREESTSQKLQEDVQIGLKKEGSIRQEQKFMPTFSSGKVTNESQDRKPQDRFLATSNQQTTSQHERRNVHFGDAIPEQR